MNYNDVLMHHYMSDDFLCHHGIKGQRWGIRRFQNPDGSLTAAGQQRYGKKLGRALQKDRRKVSKGKSNPFENLEKDPLVQKGAEAIESKMADRIKAQNKVDKLYASMYDDPEYDKYVEKAAEEVIKDYGYTGETADAIRRGYLYGDLDQGDYDTPYNSKYYYYEDHPKAKKELLEAYRKEAELDKDLSSAIDSYLNTTLGDSVNHTIATGTGLKDLKFNITLAMRDLAEKNVKKRKDD